MTDRQGRCVCGDVSYHISNAPNELDVCHCKNCQRQSGSAYAPFLAVPIDTLVLTGEPKCFRDDDTVSGRTVERYFCDRCSSPIYVRVERAPNTAYVFTGTMDNLSELQPKCHGWVTTKHDWVEINDQGVQFVTDRALMPESPA